MHLFDWADMLLNEQFCEWLTLRDLAHFDSAVTYWQYRPQLLQRLADLDIPMSSVGKHDYTEYLNWVQLRRLRLEYVHILFGSVS